MLSFLMQPMRHHIAEAVALAASSSPSRAIILGRTDGRIYNSSNAKSTRHWRRPWLPTSPSSAVTR